MDSVGTGEIGIHAVFTSSRDERDFIMVGKRLKTVVPALCIIVGAGLLLYPWISEYLYENRADSVINTHRLQAEETDNSRKQEMLAQAYLYNEQVSQSQVRLTDPFTADTASNDEMDYYSVLAVDDTGYMGSVEIPCISVDLPVYHGTSADVLEYGVGHLEGSSLPVGGEGTHAVLSGHTGLNSKKLFTDLVDMEEGDLFFIHILDETLAYEVTGISVVEPSDTSGLTIRPGEDLVTLVTCTPYGVNSHRLLVTGTRTEYTEQVYEDALYTDTGTADSLWMKSYKKAVLTGIVLVAAVGAGIGILGKIRRRGV